MMIPAGGGILIEALQAHRSPKSAGSPPLPPDIPAERTRPWAKRETLHAFLWQSASRRPSLNRFARGREIPLGKSGMSIAPNDTEPSGKLVMDEAVAASNAALPGW